MSDNPLDKEYTRLLLQKNIRDDLDENIKGLEYIQSNKQSGDYIWRGHCFLYFPHKSSESILQTEVSSCQENLINIENSIKKLKSVVDESS